MMTLKAREAPRKTHSELAHEWDAVAEKRDHQIRSGADVSYNRVLVPEVIKLSREADLSLVFDGGCGTGTLTEILAKQASEVVAVDISRRSIAIAQNSPSKGRNVKYLVASIERFSEHYDGNPFSLAVLNVMLQDTPTLRATLSAVSALLRPSGVLVATLTHPCFWPQYWGYARAEWFRYERETAIEAPFRISGVRRPAGLTTHFHRPLSQYFEALDANGFALQRLREPMPSPRLEQTYSRRWRFPRFLSLRCTRS
jgi:2-polyprenyl-3-methyl-5-hydroxy-6-metoxy-1,4-benzoquinol methylase